MGSTGELTARTCAKTFMWKVPGFKSKYLNSNDKPVQLFSPDFCLCEQWWSVKLGIQRDGQDQQHLGLFLQPRKSGKNDVFVNGTFTVFVEDDSTGDLNQIGLRKITRLFTKTRVSDLAGRKLVDAKAVTHDNIAVEVSVSAFVHGGDFSNFVVDDSTRNHLKLLRSGVAPDVTFTVEERQLTAHREVLSAQSQVFKRMFETELTESKSGKIVVLNTKAGVFEKFLDFLYTGTYPENFKLLAEDLFALAHKYKVHLLERLCITHFEKIPLDNKTAVALLLLSDKYSSLESLQDRIVDYLQENLEFLLSAEWQQLKTVSPAVAIELLTLYIMRDAED